jgi:amidase
MAEPGYTPVVTLAKALRRGELSASELTQAALARIEAAEPAINAFTYVAADAALVSAATIAAGDPRPFAGVPIAIKDNRAVTGMPLTYGSAAYAGYVPSSDAFVVRRLREAGFVIIGKTALPEAAILSTCEPRAHGATANPWVLDRTPGGSSGGSAAAVAAGMVPLAHGNDGGGSLRIPAACCGLVGLKPARGRISVGPTSGQSFLASDGVLTRTVADTAALLDVLAGYELGDATWAPPEPGPFLPAASGPPAAMHIGLALNPPFGDAEIDPECRLGVMRAAALLADLGHDVEEFEAPWSGLDVGGDFTTAFAPGAALLIEGATWVLGREPTADDFEPLTWLLAERTRQQTAVAYVTAQTRLEQLGRRLVVALDPYDAVLTPALAQRPPRTGEIHGRGSDPWEHFLRSGDYTPFTSVVNITGLPAVSLPFQLGPDGLPTGIQLIARPAAERKLLTLAAQLEQAAPWQGRRPELAL